MSPAPFIWSAYGISGLILLWTALAPLFRQKRILAAARSLGPMKKNDDPKP